MKITEQLHDSTTGITIHLARETGKPVDIAVHTVKGEVFHGLDYEFQAFVNALLVLRESVREFSKLEVPKL